MKFALSSRQTPEYLEKADEIRVQYRDREIIYDFIEKYPDKTIILEIPFYIEKEMINYQEIQTFNKLVKDFICRISRPTDIKNFEELGVRWYYGMIVDQWVDLAYLSNTKTEYVIVGGDLFFNLPKVKEFGIPLRAAPNVSNISALSNIANPDHDLSIIGDWFQPEALNIYEDYITAIEFENCNPQQERSLYRVWSKDGWPGDLTRIITNLNTKAEGRLINPTWFYISRLDCGRTCIMRQNAGCQLCYRQFVLADYDKIKAYQEKIENSELETEETN